MPYQIPSNVLHWNYRGFKQFPIQNIKGEETEITDIYLKENLISEIPNDIEKLANLESLYLSGNDITVLPKEISKLTRLKCLDISGNRLRWIPDEVGELQNLKFLILDENELSCLPLRLAEVRGLRYLSVCDNKLQWISQRPVYNYYQCELRFWRNETLRTIPYALWYHMFRGQQTRSLNIRSLQIPKCTTEPKGRCLVRVNEEYLDIIFPPNNTVIVNFAPAPPSLLELSRRKLYQTISDTTKRLTSATYSIYSDYTIEDDFSNVDINGNTTEYKDGCHNRNLNREKQYTVPNDVVKKYFDYLPSFIKKYLCNGPISRCENVNCKAPVFDYAYYEFCLEKIILIDSSSDVILSATFCSKSCADSWNVGKHVLPWKLSF
ncbi:leucine-rich repeat-containing protein 39-like isoform X1 [Aricia agestis]|uniref:leucine-rich repeat-containing protein 39-like isoform X1 n=1 Tax=Aricia agestis TaxID=91739 RepID=UPI001C20431B|nr:leucine-rich repeat-containing protein 39-like isoform X1 [Aricia agestis]